MNKVYDVVADYEDDGVVNTKSLGARRTRAEAEAHLATFTGPWQNLRIEEIDTTGLFEIPTRPTPRERYKTRVTGGYPFTTMLLGVEVLDGERLIGSFDRNYSMLRTFEPFRQGDRDFALVSPEYTATSVMDLQTGEIVAGEEPSAGGFCPVGFYVPDWWDLYEASAEYGELPGSRGWTTDYEWPNGDFGFVWGCVWGDDSSWKVQYLDLSAVQQGIIRREERFGYVVLETGDQMDDAKWPDARDFIYVASDEGELRVEFRTRQTYKLVTGEPTDQWG